MIKFLKMNNLYDEAINDFPQAKSFLYDRIRLGSKYVFGWHYCTVLRYNDIIKVYQYVRKANFQEMERVLHAVDKLGNVWSLCKLDTHAPTIFFHHANELVDKRLMEVISLMLHKNPKIIVGYW